MCVMVLNLMFYDVCRASFLLWYVKCLEKGLHALCPQWNTITWHMRSCKKAFLHSYCKWQKALCWKPRSWCHNVNGTYWHAAEHRRHWFLSLDILHIYESSQYHLSNNIKAWELKLSVLCPQTASLSTHGYEYHIAMVTGKIVVKHSLLVFLDGVAVIAKNIFSCLKTCIFNENKI